MYSLFLCNKIFPIKKITIDSTSSLAFFSKNQLIFRPSLAFFSKNQLIFRPVSSKASKNQHSLSVSNLVNSSEGSSNEEYKISYLINSCGLSPEKAISISEKVKFKTLEKPNSVLTLLRNHGFSKIQIANLVRRRPVVLLSDPENTLLPKLEFFQSIGVSKTDLAKTLSRDPTLLTRSLENQIIPCYNFLKSVLQSNERVVAAMRRTSWIFLEDHSKNLVPNITLLRKLEVPESCVVLLLTHFPEAIIQKHERFVEVVTRVNEMGFDPLKSTFVLAVHSLSGKGNKSIWDRCFESYKKWGWSEDDIQLAFRKHPHCMILSEKKISRSMDFLVNKMGWPSKEIASCPSILFFSLEKRIIPRCSVIQVLLSKGLIKKVSLSTLLLRVEKSFLERYVTKYGEEAPQLLGVYQGKADIMES